MIKSSDELFDKLRRSVSGYLPPVEYLQHGINPLQYVLGTIVQECEQRGVEPYGTLEVYPAMPFEPMWHFQIESEMSPLPPPRIVTYKFGVAEGDKPIRETVLLDNCAYWCPCG